MSNSRDNTLFQVATAGLSLAALYYCVSCFISGINELRNAKLVPEEKKDGLEGIGQDLAKDFKRNFFKESEQAATLRARVRGAAYLGASGLMLFGAYKGFRALEAGESPEFVPATIGLVAGGLAVNSLISKKMNIL